MPRMLVIGYVWPEPKSSAAGKRMMQLLELFLSRDYDLIFASTATETPYQVDLRALGIKTAEIELNSGSFDTFIQEINPEVVLYDRYMMEEQFGWRVRAACPNALQVLDTEDLHFLRKARQESVSKGIPVELTQLQTSLAKREIASIYRSDLSLIISKSEMKVLLEQFLIPEALLYYLPLMRQSENISPESRPDFEDRQDFISLGNFLHPPNWDAVLQLKTTIWPLIRQAIPNASLHIYGAYPTSKVHQLHNTGERFLIKGRAHSARKVLESARVLLAPLRFGAGIKGKFLDAMAAGTPSVTTVTGAEAMTSQRVWGGSIENEPQGFAKAAISLYQSKSDWTTAQTTGFQILQNFPGPEAGQRFADHLEALLRELPEHRSQNFVGQLLQHHHHQSTRYLSKYIEAKNKLK